MVVPIRNGGNRRELMTATASGQSPRDVQQSRRVRPSDPDLVGSSDLPDSCESDARVCSQIRGFSSEKALSRASDLRSAAPSRIRLSCLARTNDRSLPRPSRSAGSEICDIAEEISSATKNYREVCKASDLRMDLASLGGLFRGGWSFPRP